MPTEVTHYNIQPTIELTMGVYGRDLGHVSDDVTKVLNSFGILESPGKWAPYDPRQQGKETAAGLDDRPLGRIPANERDVQQPGRRA